MPLRIAGELVGWVRSEAVADQLTGRYLWPREVVALRSDRRFVVVPQASIVYATSISGPVMIFADSGRFWTDQTLAQVERRLDPSRFFRLDASHVVNLTRVAELIPWTHQRYRLIFADQAKTELVLSRDVGRRLRATLGW